MKLLLKTKLVVNPVVALIEAEQPPFARGQGIAGKRNFTVKNARLTHPTQSFLCIP